MKQTKIKCPYCGALATLRPASFVYGSDSKSGHYLYVCDRYPHCNAYVGAHRKNLTPMGTLANGDLRNKRIKAHHAFDLLWKQGPMTKSQAYRWMQAKFALRSDQAHIGKFSEYMCDQLIAVCTEAAHNMKLAA